MSLVFEFLLLGLFAAGLVGVFMILKARMSDNKFYKIGIGLALLAAFLLFWVNGAVGIIGSSNNDANMLYVGVIGVIFVGALVSRFKPGGLSITMAVATIVLVLIPVFAIVLEIDITEQRWQTDVFVMTVFFAAILTSAAWSFSKAVDRPATDSGVDAV